MRLKVSCTIILISIYFIALANDNLEKHSTNEILKRLQVLSVTTKIYKYLCIETNNISKNIKLAGDKKIKNQIELYLLLSDFLESEIYTDPNEEKYMNNFVNFIDSSKTKISHDINELGSNKSIHKKFNSVQSESLEKSIPVYSEILDDIEQNNTLISNNIRDDNKEVDFAALVCMKKNSINDKEWEFFFFWFR